MADNPAPKKVLFLSDTHIGGESSNLEEYQNNLFKKMKEYDQVVLIGDIWELFYVDKKHHLDQLGGTLQALTHQSSNHWKKIIEALPSPSSKDMQSKTTAEYLLGGTQVDEFLEQNVKSDAKKHSQTRTNAENIINGAIVFVDAFQKENPNIHLDFISGNHEKFERFHNEFQKLRYRTGTPVDKIPKALDKKGEPIKGPGGLRRFDEKFEQEYHNPNFEWTPEAMRIGDTLITHGHLPLRDETLEEQKLLHLKDASKNQRWTKTLHAFVPLEHIVQKAKDETQRAHKLVKRLKKMAKEGEFYVRYNGMDTQLAVNSEGKLVFSDGVAVKNIIFGHTHVKYNNLQLGEEDDYILAHNTGAFVETTAGKPDDLGVLEGKLTHDGKLIEMQPVRIEKDGPPTHIR